MAPTDVTRLIHRVHGGDELARDDLWSLVYNELRRLAAGQMARERGEHTLQPTALVHEAWLRLVGHGEPAWQNRAHFFGVAAEAMRRILVEHARRRGRLRRGGDRVRVPLSESDTTHGADPGRREVGRGVERDDDEGPRAADGSADPCWEVLAADLAGNHRLADDLAALDAALERFESSPQHARKCQVVKLRFFVGMTNEQAAEVLGTSVSSVKRDWEFAKAWLTRALAEAPGPQEHDSSP